MSHQASDIITPKALLLDERLTPLERNACKSRRCTWVDELIFLTPALRLESKPLVPMPSIKMLHEH